MVPVYLPMTCASQPTLQLGLGHFPTWLSCCDGGGAGRVRERSFQNPRPVLLARCQVTLTPSLEVVLALP